MSPLLSRLGVGAISGGFGFGKTTTKNIAVLVTFTVETFGAGGAIEFNNILNYPRYGYGGYNKVSITALSNQIGYVQISGSGRRCYSSFYIDNQWIVVAGGGGEPSSNVIWTTNPGGGGFGDAYTVSGSNGGDGEGGYNQSEGGNGPRDGCGQSFATAVIDSTHSQWWVSGGYGSGAPPLAYPYNPNSAYSLVPGPGGKGNIRCYYDNGVTSGIVGNNICTMSFVTSGTGVNDGPAKVVITNSLTGRSQTYSQPSNYNDAYYNIPLSNIITY